MKTLVNIQTKNTKTEENLEMWKFLKKVDLIKFLFYNSKHLKIS